MKKRTKGFLSDEMIDHCSEQFDYIKELHEYLWRFVRCELPGVNGSLTRYLDTAIYFAELKKKKNTKKSLNVKNQPSCLGANMPGIYSMKLHEVIALTPTSVNGTAVSYFSVMRVAGGWIYQTWDTEKQDYVRETFVPLNNEFQ